MPAVLLCWKKETGGENEKVIKVILGMIAVIAVVAVAMMYGGYIEEYIEEEIPIPQIKPPSFVSDTKCLYVELNHWEKVEEDAAISKGIDDVCIPDVVDWNIVYDHRGPVEITIETKERTMTFRRTYPTESQPRFMVIGEVKEFDTCEECEAFCERLAKSLGYEKGNRR